jgi:hypothetical protein
METTIAKYRGFGKVPLVALLAVVAVVATMLTTLVVSQPAEAHGSNLPYHASGGAACFDYNKIWTKVPTQMRSWNGTTQMENVYWKPRIERYNPNTGSWYTYSEGPWLQAAANGYGLRSLWSRMDNGQIYQGGNGPVFSNLHSGYYRVWERYYWGQSGVGHWQLAYINGSSTQCRV